jgi:hypothetical protein
VLGSLVWLITYGIPSTKLRNFHMNHSGNTII